MSGGKKRSGFQITSVTSDLNETPTGQSAPGVLSVLRSSCSAQGKSSHSQPTTPSLTRRHFHAQEGQGVGSSRFRVVRLAGGRGEPYRRGRWTCTDFLEWQEGAGFRRVMDSMRHALSLESLEMIGLDREESGAGVHVHSQGTSHPLAQPMRGKGAGLTLHRGLSSPMHQESISIRLLDSKQPMGVQALEITPLPPSPRPRNIPPPLRLDVDAAGRSVLRLSRSQPSSPPHTRTPAAFSLDQTMFSLPGDGSGSSNSLIAIDNKIEQAMDLVKSHLMLAVREEVEFLREQIRELTERNHTLERENLILRALTHS